MTATAAPRANRHQSIAAGAAMPVTASPSHDRDDRNQQRRRHQYRDDARIQKQVGPDVRDAVESTEGSIARHERGSPEHTIDDRNRSNGGDRKKRKQHRVLSQRFDSGRRAARSRKMSRPAGTRTSGARFGRVRIARPAAAPAPSVLTRRSRGIRASDRVHHAAAARSLSGAVVNCRRTGGLVATRTAAIAPATGPCARAPRRYVAQTSTPPRMGTTQNTLPGPAMRSKSAMTMGSPGEYVGAIVFPSTDGRYPSGDRTSSVSAGTGTRDSAGCWRSSPMFQR